MAVILANCLWQLSVAVFGRGLVAALMAKFDVGGFGL